MCTSYGEVGRTYRDGFFQQLILNGDRRTHAALFNIPTLNPDVVAPLFRIENVDLYMSNTRPESSAHYLPFVTINYKHKLVLDALEAFQRDLTRLVPTCHLTFKVKVATRMFEA